MHPSSHWCEFQVWVIAGLEFAKQRGGGVWLYRCDVWARVPAIPTTAGVSQHGLWEYADYVSKSC